jgi:DNA-binding beta-propeller fold protein YncE
MAIMPFLGGCQHEAAKIAEPASAADNFPPGISRILQNTCAVAGCHNAASYRVSGGGLLLDSWEHLFEGGDHGAVAVPYSPESSSLLFFINSYPDYGDIPDASLQMPLNGTPLSREDYLALQSWIKAGAPDKDGQVAFSSEAATRQKVYVSHQGCDYVTVIDAEKHVIMRTIPIGQLATIESAYDLKIAPNGAAYVSLWATDKLFKIDTRTDSVSGSIPLAPNSNIMHPSPDGKELLVASWYRNGVLRVSTVDDQVKATYRGSDMAEPHGIAANQAFDTFFVTEFTGNTVHRISAAGAYGKVSVDGTPPGRAAGKPNPYEILMAPDYGKYFLTCPGTNDVRIMDARADTLIGTIRVGKKPQGMAISRNPGTPYLFVSCEEDDNTISIYKGSVYVINYNDYSVVDKISERYYMPHALTVDDKNGVLYVFSRNIDPAGPVPHHNSSVCEGRSGYYSIYDFKALKPLNNKRYEVSVDPFAADVRFK